MTARRVLLLRHTAVSPAWAGRCYGGWDVPLGAEGRRDAHALARAVPVEEFDLVLASPLRRARLLGGLLARRRGVALAVEPLLAERDFGTWEGRSWDAIWAEEGSAMDGILDAPDTFRPGGGETTSALGARALAWFRALPPGASVLAVSHGGPIGALAGSLRGEGPRGWLAHVPRQGEGVMVGPGMARWGRAGEGAALPGTLPPGAPGPLDPHFLCLDHVRRRSRRPSCPCRRPRS